MTDRRIARIERLELRFEERRWAFADERRADIDAHFERLRRDKPLWNGAVLLMHEHAIEGTLLRGAYLKTDYASFLAWRDWNFPDLSIRNCFAPAALQGSDGGYVLGMMGHHTANAGKIYFPCGTPDLADVAKGKVDLEGSVRRELFEETGILADELTVDPGWYAVFAAPRIALIKPMRARDPAENLQRRIRQYIAREREPELADVYVARGPADLDPRMPDFVRMFLVRNWQ